MILPIGLMIGALVVLGLWAVSSLRDVDAPSADHRAALEREGVGDPDHELNVRLRRLADAPDEDASGPLQDGDRRTRAEEDAVRSAAEQQETWTPGADRSTRMGA